MSRPNYSNVISVHFGFDTTDRSYAVSPDRICSLPDYTQKYSTDVFFLLKSCIKRFVKLKIVQKPGLKTKLSLCIDLLLMAIIPTG